MDSDSNQLPGLGLPPPSVAQDGHASVGVPGPAQAVPLSPADGDTLDQAWVNKAKDIVERTKGDPFVESNELQKIRTGYLAARYNKHANVRQEHGQ